MSNTHAQHTRSYSASVPAAARDPSFAELSPDDLHFFQEVLGPGGVVTDDDALAVANTDWMNKYHGKSKLLLRPRSTQQVTIAPVCQSEPVSLIHSHGV